MSTTGRRNDLPRRKALTGADLRARNVLLIDALRQIAREADRVLQSGIVPTSTGEWQEVRKLAIDSINTTKDHT
jgi:hypothetical protein